MNSLTMISGRIKCRELITTNVFLWSRHIPCASGKRLSRLSIERELESLLVDWERKTISHCDSIPLWEVR